MTIKVCGTWEFAFDTPIKEHEQWAYGLQDFGVDEWIMFPKTGIRSSRVIEYDTLEDVIEDNKDLTPVFVVENGEIDSMNFEHPENVLYILGKASYNPFNALKNKFDDPKSVRIETPFSKGGLWGHQAILLLLRDKQWQLR